MTANEISDKISAYINGLSYDRTPASLYEPIRYVLSMGGKRIRPMLMLLSYNLYKENPGEILPTACALETYHNYTLLHDDLMDNAGLRRGHLTVHEKWDANKAILSGDTMLVLAFQRMLQCKATKLKPVLDLFTETALQVGEGQELDMSYERRRDVTENEYIEMIRLKTSVLLACAMEMGAILADAPCKDSKNLYKFGEQVGIAFQLQDDYLDVYGDPKLFGKAVGGDIVSNKKTYMFINAFNMASDNQREQLNGWTSKRDFDPTEKVKAVTELYNIIGIDKLAKRKIAHYFERSKQYIDAVSVPEERKGELMDYVSSIMLRQS